MSMNTVPERLAALREAMKANGVDVYLIPVGDPHASEYMPDHYTALTYFSGFHGENSNFVVTMTESAVWADGRYFVQAEKEIAGTEIQLMRMGEPGVPTAEQYCGKVLPEGGKLGLCGLTASCGLVRSLQKELDAKKGTIKLLDLEDELWTEGRPALPATRHGSCRKSTQASPLPRSWASCVRSSLSWAAPHSWWASWTIWHGCSTSAPWTSSVPPMPWLTAM